MNQPKYPVFAFDDYIYAFVSDGPKGKIQKIITYKNIGGNFYNLAFGDWDQESQAFDDSTRSNNGDMDMILATVAMTALEFLDRFPDAEILFEGSSHSRTRLYQIAIGRNLLEINEQFKVMGLINDHWLPFEPGVNYESFLVTRNNL